MPGGLQRVKCATQKTGALIHSGLIKMDSQIRQHIDRICGSDIFRTTPRLRDLLVFLTSQSPSNGAQSLKETVIGVEFFRRDPGYDPKKDPIVRVEAHRLRRRLLDYYNQEGLDDTWR